MPLDRGWKRVQSQLCNPGNLAELALTILIALTLGRGREIEIVLLLRDLSPSDDSSSNSKIVDH